jgi:nucleoside-diphosphate-sugar epimerase
VKVLITGASGNVGTSAVRELLAQQHRVRCFVHKLKPAAEFAGRTEVRTGDIRDAASLNAVVAGPEVVIHSAAIIPPLSEIRPDWSRSINVGGTRQVLAAIKSQPKPPKLVYVSSVALFGRDQDAPVVRTIADSIKPSDHYTEHKLECERLVRESGLEWTILRLGHVVPSALKGKDPRLMFREMFEVPLDQPTEIIHTHDAGLALANAASSSDIWGKTLLVAGGSSCQINYGQFVKTTLNAMGIGMFPESAFSSRPYHTHWMDTTESQRLLRYQRYSFQDYARQIAATPITQRLFIRALRPLIRRWILRQSPYYPGQGASLRHAN